MHRLPVHMTLIFVYGYFNNRRKAKANHFLVKGDTGKTCFPCLITWAVQNIDRQEVSRNCSCVGKRPCCCLLVGMSVRDLSISPFLSANVRHAIRRLTLEQAKIIAKTVLSAAIPEEVQDILASAF